MRAVVCSEHGMADKLTLENDWAEPTVGENDVLIDIKAGGLNFPDVLTIQGKYQTQPDMPFIPGGECAGVVAAVGSAVTRFKPGDNVVSMGGVGAFAERIAAHEMSVFPMPEGLSYEQAAGVAITYFTSYYALKQRANLQSGETLLVLGAAGGVGSTAVDGCVLHMRVDFLVCSGGLHILPPELKSYKNQNMEFPGSSDFQDSPDFCGSRGFVDFLCDI